MKNKRKQIQKSAQKTNNFCLQALCALLSSVIQS